ncbi:MAG: UTP--glucose-1-phosphate uridylyltransferase [Verrucomicrobiae bacterium]|nr:UTP--glucose-1-phosphate uridylyltransferase [Verrucomicrobiae bacterium]
MNITKAVITAAGKDQRRLPLQNLVDRTGQSKSALTIILDEVFAAGIEETAVIVCPGDIPSFSAAAGEHASKIRFIEQNDPKGYGDALLRARSFTGTDSFLHLISDHLYLSFDPGRSCVAQLLETARGESVSVSAVQATRETKLPHYGAVGGVRVANKPGQYLIHQVLEKPTPTEAEQQLIVPGLRSGYYLCYFGIHVLTPGVMDLLDGQSAESGGTLSLSPALAELARREKYLALELRGRRYNIGLKYGLLTAQLALALAGNDREEVLSQMVELLAEKERHIQ